MRVRVRGKVMVRGRVRVTGICKSPRLVFSEPSHLLTIEIGSEVRVRVMV